MKELRDLQPISITIDYEMATINSIKDNFPGVHIHGCLFHFGQCLWRQIQSCGLQSWYNDPSNSMVIKMIQALAFCPCGDVIALFNEILETLDEETDDLLSGFLSYFENTWLGTISRNRRRRPLFSISMWSVHARTVESLPRTNNSVEGWHNAFQQRVNTSHPNLCKLVSKIRKEQSECEITIEHAIAGIYPRDTQRKYKELTRRLMVLVEGYEMEKGLEFLRAISHNIYIHYVT